MLNFARPWELRDYDRHVKAPRGNVHDARGHGCADAWRILQRLVWPREHCWPDGNTWTTAPRRRVRGSDHGLRDHGLHDRDDGVRRGRVRDDRVRDGRVRDCGLHGSAQRRCGAAERRGALRWRQRKFPVQTWPFCWESYRLDTKSFEFPWKKTEFGVVCNVYKMKKQTNKLTGCRKNRRNTFETFGKNDVYESDIRSSQHVTCGTLRVSRVSSKGCLCTVGGGVALNLGAEPLYWTVRGKDFRKVLLTVNSSLMLRYDWLVLFRLANRDSTCVVLVSYAPMGRFNTTAVFEGKTISVLFLNFFFFKREKLVLFSFHFQRRDLNLVTDFFSYDWLTLARVRGDVRRASATSGRVIQSILPSKR